jgi:hypothetical protein
MPGFKLHGNISLEIAEDSIFLYPCLLKMNPSLLTANQQTTY